MKLKNLKIYLLAILSTFLFSLKTQAIIINIEEPIPHNFFISNPSIKRIIDIAQGGNFNPDTNPCKDPEIFNNTLNNMKKHLSTVTKGIPTTYADRHNLGILVQSIILELNGEEIDLFFQSHIPTIQLKSSKNKKYIPNNYFQHLNDNKTWLIKHLKKIILSRNDINLDPILWNKPDSIKIEEKWESTDDNNICHQFILINFNTKFILFDFQTSANQQ